MATRTRDQRDSEDPIYSSFCDDVPETKRSATESSIRDDKPDSTPGFTPFTLTRPADFTVNPSATRAAAAAAASVPVTTETTANLTYTTSPTSPEYVYSGMLSTGKDMVIILKMLGVHDTALAKEIVYYSRSFYYYYTMLSMEYRLKNSYNVTSEKHYKDKEYSLGKPMIKSLNHLYELERADATQGKIIIFCPSQPVQYIDSRKQMFGKKEDTSANSDLTIYATDGTNRAVTAYKFEIDYIITPELLSFA